MNALRIPKLFTNYEKVAKQRKYITAASLNGSWWCERRRLLAVHATLTDTEWRISGVGRGDGPQWWNGHK